MILVSLRLWAIHLHSTFGVEIPITHDHFHKVFITHILSNTFQTTYILITHLVFMNKLGIFWEMPNFAAFLCVQYRVQY